jgi:hypothetical protein
LRNQSRLLGILTASSFLLCVGPALAHAQTPLVTLTGNQSSNELYGRAISPAGDIDADGVPDFAVGAANAVRIYSGATHQVLHTVLGGGALGASLAPAGDFDLDGHDDLLAGAPKAGGSGAVVILSGLDGSALHLYSGAAYDDNFGEAVANAGDVNGDGRADYLVGAPYREVDGVENVGAAVIYSGADGSLLRTFVGTHYDGYFGSFLAGIGDVDGDGFADVAIVQRGLEGFLGVYSGFDGSSIRVHSPSSQFAPARQVAGVGDLNGDGVPDYAAGSPDTPAVPPHPKLGHVRVFSGLDGSVLHEFEGPVPGSLLGWAVDSAGDVDGDGLPDILIGSAGGQLNAIGRVDIYSGSDWSLLQTFPGGSEVDSFGKSVAGVGDTNGDGRADVLLGFYGSTPSTFSVGAVRLYSGLDTAPWYVYCEALPNSSYPRARIAYVGSPSVSEANLDLVVTFGAQWMVGLFLYGQAQQQTPFGNGNLCVGGGVFRVPQPFVLGLVGNSGVSLDFSQPPLGGGPGMITPGSTWNFQAWFRDTPAGGAGFNLSNALSATFVP